MAIRDDHNTLHLEINTYTVAYERFSARSTQSRIAAFVHTFFMYCHFCISKIPEYNESIPTLECWRLRGDACMVPPAVGIAITTRSTGELYKSIILSTNASRRSREIQGKSDISHPTLYTPREIRTLWHTARTLWY